MSENLDLVRSIYADVERRDFDRVVRDARERVHPEFEWVIADGPRPGSFKGVTGIEESFYAMFEAWEDLRFEVEEYRELDGERVLVLHRFSARGKTSGPGLGQVRSNAAGLFHVRGGKVTRVVLYWDRERAFADLGLAPETGTADPPG